MTRWWQSGGPWKGLLRAVGLGIVINEALSARPGERPILYLVACAMMGVTVTIPADRRRKNGDDK
jgi:hypothetical protein